MVGAEGCRNFTLIVKNVILIGKIIAMMTLSNGLNYLCSMTDYLIFRHFKIH